MKMVAAGDSRQVDEYYLDALPKAKEGEEDWYSEMRKMPNFRAYRFGKMAVSSNSKVLYVELLIATVPANNLFAQTLQI
jgi:hypothetical protein